MLTGHSGTTPSGYTLTQGGTVLQSLTYTYDAANRLTEVKAGGTSAATYGYDQNGNRTLLSYANGTSESYAYNLANAVTGLQNKQGTAVLSRYAYAYYLDGNQKSKTDHTGKVTSYTYDGLGRLAQESESKTGGQSLAYTYDARSNRATLTATGAESYTTAYSYDAADRLLSTVKTAGTTAETTDRGYDPNGNLDTDPTIGEETIPDIQARSVEDIVANKLMIEKLHNCIGLLSHTERELIKALFFLGESEREHGEKIGISQKGVNKRRAQVIRKL